MIGNIIMKIFDGIICCFDSEFYEVANWADRLLLCNVLKKGVLVHRSFRTRYGRTEDTVVLMEAVCRSQA